MVVAFFLTAMRKIVKDDISKDCSILSDQTVRPKKSGVTAKSLDGHCVSMSTTAHFIGGCLSVWL